MAVVKLTPPVKQSITRKIEAKYDQLIAQQGRRLTEPQHADAYYRLVVDEDTEKRACQLPNSMVNYGSNIRFKYQNRHFDVQLSSSRPLPKEFESSYNPYTLKIPFPPELQSLLHTVQDEEARLRKEREVLTEEAKRLMEQCRTLKQLLEVWPSAIDFCDGEIKARHMRPDPVRFKAQNIQMADDAKLALVKVRMT